MHRFTHTINPLRLATISLVVVLLAACGAGSAGDESELPTPIPTIEPFVTPPPPQPTPAPEVEPTLAPTPVPLPEPEATAEPLEEDAVDETEPPVDDAELPEDDDVTEEAIDEEAVEDADAQAAAHDEDALDEELVDEALDDEPADPEEAVIHAPQAHFLQPTNNAIVPVTFTVKAHVQGLTLLPYAGEAQPDDQDAAENGNDNEVEEEATEEEAEETALDEDAELDETELEATNGADEADENGNGENENGDAGDEEAATDASESSEIDNAIDNGDEPALEEAEENGENGAAHLFVLVNVPHFEPGETVDADGSFVVPVDPDGAAQLSLVPGAYILRLQLTDADSAALETAEQDEIIVVVKEDAAEQAVRFAMPSDHAVVPPEFDVVMAAAGLTIEPIGEVRPGAGHFHILVNEEFVEPGEIIPADETHLHFGAGQLTATVSLEPGVHVLRLQLADGLHSALEGDEYRDEITVTVVEDAPRNQVMFIEPEDGAEVTSPFDLRWAAAGLLVEPIGAVLDEGRGHLHVLVDEEFVEAGQVVISDETHLHFGAGQMETVLNLEPGEYTLRLQMANGAHITLEGDEYRDEISVTVVDSPTQEDADENGEATEDETGTDETDANETDPEDAQVEDNNADEDNAQE